MTTLRDLYVKLGLVLDRARAVVGAHFKVTLIARYTKGDLEDADIFIGNDEIDDVARTIEKLKKRAPFEVV